MFKKLFEGLKNSGIIFVCAILGAVGGQGFKYVRRFIYPAVITIYALYNIHNLWILSIYTISFWLSIGYGIPSQDDKGSFLGRFFYNLFKHNELWANIFTRGTIGILISLSAISIPILKGTWASYIIGLFVIIAIWSGVSWQGIGEIPVKLFGKDIVLLKSDLITYAVTTCGLLLIIYGF